MKPRQITFAKILTYSGTLPLVASVVVLYFPVAELGSARFANTYGAIILSFLSGIHWAVYLFFAEKSPRNLLITSNAIALLAWVSLLINDLPIALFLQALCFLYLLTLDIKLRDAGIFPPWFFKLRCYGTIIVVLCLSILAAHV